MNHRTFKFCLLAVVISSLNTVGLKGQNLTGQSIFLQNGSALSFPSYSGERTMFFWNPGNHSFRSGQFYNWAIQDYLGEYSFVHGRVWETAPWSVYFGNALYGGGIYGFNQGYNNFVDGSHSIAMGSSNNAEYSFSVALGYNNSVMGDHGKALGSLNYVYGDHGVAIGYALQIYSQDTVAVGLFNHPVTTVTNSNANDRPLFIVGNGTSGSTNDRSNAMVVRANGVVEILKIAPSGDIPTGVFE